MVTDASAVVSYVSSMTETARVSEAGTQVLEEIGRRVDRSIDRDGAFRVRTHVACFVCR